MNKKEELWWCCGVQRPISKSCSCGDKYEEGGEKESGEERANRDLRNDINRFQEIQDEIDSLTDEALSIIKLNCSKKEYESAKAYWHPQIKKVIRDDTEWLGGSMHSMEKSLEALNKAYDEV